MDHQYAAQLAHRNFLKRHWLFFMFHPPLAVISAYLIFVADQTVLGTFVGGCWLALGGMFAVRVANDVSRARERSIGR